LCRLSVKGWSVRSVMLGFGPMTTDFNRDDYLTVEQVADMWGIRPNSVLKAIHRGRLPAMRAPAGRRYFIHKRDAMPRPVDQK
jgi:excisionase family DNA binding protein